MGRVLGPITSTLAHLPVVGGERGDDARQTEHRHHGHVDVDMAVGRILDGVVHGDPCDDRAEQGEREERPNLPALTVVTMEGGLTAA